MQLAANAELAVAGHVNERGRPFNSKSVAAMLTASCSVRETRGAA